MRPSHALSLLRARHPPSTFVFALLPAQLHITASTPESWSPGEVTLRVGAATGHGHSIGSVRESERKRKRRREGSGGLREGGREGGGGRETD